MRTIAVVTVARSDYGVILPVLKRIQADAALRLQLLVSGAHLAPEFGLTIRGIEADGFTAASRVEMLLSSDSPAGVTTSLGLGVMGFGAVYARDRPDIVLVLGDRPEMFAAALAALAFAIPVAHVHGGELTHGAIDDALRHAMTKLSHLHFVSTEAYAQRVRQLGEESWRITVSGAPALDNLATLPLLTRAELEARTGVALGDDPLLVTLHPVTLEPAQGDHYTTELLAAIAEAAMPVIFTQPNADAGGRQIGERVDEFVRAHAFAHRVDNLGVQAYFSLMRIAAAMVGNSSSGIIEAPSFALPVVNIGSRQSGRVRARNVIDVAPERGAILGGIRRAVSSDFRAGLRGMENPYGSGHAAEAIVERLKSVPLDAALIAKRFHDILPAPAG